MKSLNDNKCQHAVIKNKAIATHHSDNTHAIYCKVLLPYNIFWHRRTAETLYWIRPKISSWCNIHCYALTDQVMPFCIRNTNIFNLEFYSSLRHFSKPHLCVLLNAAFPSTMLLIMTTVQLHFIIPFSL